MNAAVVQSFDAPPRYATFADPIPGEGERLVSVTAAGLHPIVKALAKGAHYASPPECFPLCPESMEWGNSRTASASLWAPHTHPSGASPSAVSPPALCAFPCQTASTTPPPQPSQILRCLPGLPLLRGQNSFRERAQLLIFGAAGVAGQLAIQIAKYLGARRVIAAGRGSLDKLKGLGADAVIQTDQEPAAVVSALRAEIAGAGIDVVLDYLWGEPAERFFEAISQKGLSKSARSCSLHPDRRQRGQDHPSLCLHPAQLRARTPWQRLRQRIVRPDSASNHEFFDVAAKHPFQFRTKTASLRNVEALWNTGGDGVRLVFQP